MASEALSMSAVEHIVLIGQRATGVRLQRSLDIQRSMISLLLTPIMASNAHYATLDPTAHDRMLQIDISTPIF
jgi:hypothetical protein